MNNSRVLYLASQSRARARLLEEARIPFSTISHSSAEDLLYNGASFEEHVCAIAQDKNQKILFESIGEPREKEMYFFLVADSLAFTHHSKQILGKPCDIADAHRMLGLLRAEDADVITACVLSKRYYHAGTWQEATTAAWTVLTQARFCIPERDVERYLALEPYALQACGAAIVEGYGAQFLERINGSYSALCGLPLFELREHLVQLGFFN